MRTGILPTLQMTEPIQYRKCRDKPLGGDQQGQVMDPKAETPHNGPDVIPRKRFGRRASIIGSIVAVLALVGTGWLAWHLTHPSTDSVSAASGPTGRRGAPATTVGVATAERASVPVVLEALGTVTPQATVKVRPQVSGVMEKVLFKEGQMVRSGDLLATIDPRQFELAQMQTTGQRQRDEAQLESAKVTLQRYKTLLEQDSIAVRTSTLRRHSSNSWKARW
jgi:multidrug efflux system membrane fusion protein